MINNNSVFPAEHVGLALNLAYNMYKVTLSIVVWDLLVVNDFNLISKTYFLGLDSINLQNLLSSLSS